jgi:hypothetical protein
MISIEEIGTVVYEWCDMVLNGATVTIKDKDGNDKDLDGSEILGLDAPALNVPLKPSTANTAGREDLYLSIQQTPESYTDNGITPIQLGVDSDYDFNNPIPDPTYSVATDITDSSCTLEIREVNGKGKHLSILNKLMAHPMVSEFFHSYSMALLGIEGNIQSVPFTTDKSYHLESIATFLFGTMDGISYNQDFIAAVSGSYGIQNANGATVVSGTFNTENTGE